MIRTNIVTLTVIPAIAYRQKIKGGKSGIVILRPDVSQPGMAEISRTSGEPIPNRQTNLKKYPLDAFKEAMTLTVGMPYKQQNYVKVTKDMVAKPVKEKEEPDEVEIALNEDAYNKVVAHYTDKTGHLSYDLINKDFIKFAHSSSIVRNMIACDDSAADIRDYIVYNKIRNISGNDDLTDAEIDLIVSLLDEVSPKGIFKELNSEIRKMKKEAKPS